MRHIDYRTEHRTNFAAATFDIAHLNSILVSFNNIIINRKIKKVTSRFLITEFAKHIIIVINDTRVNKDVLLSFKQSLEQKQ